MIIAGLYAREVLDSRGNPTVEVEVHCHDGSSGRAIVPSGASTGRHEARELRDGDPARYGGKGVRQAVANVMQQLAPPLLGLPVTDQERIDAILIERDGTPDKSRLGANALLGVSLACAHAAAASRKQSLWRYLDTDGVARMPLPMVNLISGGLHAGGNLDVQDFLLLPLGARSYSEALEMTVAVYRSLGRVLTRHGFEGVLVGDEGGFGPRLHSNEQAIELILTAFSDIGLSPGRDAALALDVASTHFYRDGRYHLHTGGDTALTADEMIERLRRWVAAYPILSIEDGLAEDDWPGWVKLTQALGERVQLIGDDLFVTNPARLQPRHRNGRGQRGAGEGESDRHVDRDTRSGTAGAASGVSRRHLGAERRNGGQHARRSGGGARNWPDQNRLRGRQRAVGEIQPAVAHRGRDGTARAVYVSRNVNSAANLTPAIRAVPARARRRVACSVPSAFSSP